MPRVRIILARTEGGLDAVADDAGATIINGTATEHSGLGTNYEPDADPGSTIDNEDAGWIALATIPD